MISIPNSSVSFVGLDELTRHSVASACSLDLSCASLDTTAVSGAVETRPVSVSVLGEFGPGVSATVRERINGGRPTGALVAEAAAQAKTYAFAAAGAGAEQQTKHEHEMWAFRGPEPWSQPA